MTKEITVTAPVQLQKVTRLVHGSRETEYHTTSKMRHASIKSGFGEMLIPGEPLGKQEKPISIQSSFSTSIPMKWKISFMPKIKIKKMRSKNRWFQVQRKAICFKLTILSQLANKFCYPYIIIIS